MVNPQPVETDQQPTAVRRVNWMFWLSVVFILGFSILLAHMDYSNFRFDRVRRERQQDYMYSSSVIDKPSPFHREVRERRTGRTPELLVPVLASSEPVPSLSSGPIRTAQMLEMAAQGVPSVSPRRTPGEVPSLTLARTATEIRGSNAVPTVTERRTAREVQSSPTVPGLTAVRTARPVPSVELVRTAREIPQVERVRTPVMRQN